MRAVVTADVKCGRFLFLRILTCHSILGTPTEDVWPGVTSYPDFKSSFPKWERNFDKPLCHSLDDAGLHMLEAMLVYDPAGRMSAKQACNHPYFEEYLADLPPTTSRTNGYH